jgi:DNA-binding NarL/FixJ family response regulator
VRVLIADDHELVRKGLGAIFKGEPDWTICGEAANGQEAVDLVAKLLPDLVLLDITMPLMNGLTAAAKIRKLAPATKILIVSMHDSPVAAREALKAGADAFLHKSAGGFNLMRAIDAIFRDGAPVVQAEVSPTEA